MKWFKTSRALVQNLLGHARRDRELDDEIQSYAQLLSDEKMAQGLPPQEAHRAARIEMGGLQQVREQVRSARRGATLEVLWQDLRYGTRMLYKKPGFAAVAILTLALGIGANTAIFSVLNASLLARVPIPSPDRVFMVWTENAFRNLHEVPASVPDYFDWKASGIFQSLAAFKDDGFNVRIGNKTDRLPGLRVTSEWFDIQQAKPYLGRLFNTGDMRPGNDHVALLSYDLWSSRFAADQQIVGKSAVVDGRPFTIIGVLPKRVLTIGQEKLYVPLVFEPPLSTDRGSRSISVVGRLQGNGSVAAARQRMSDLSAKLAKEYRQDVGCTIQLQAAQDAYVEDVQDLVLLLLCAAGFVLLVACANVANLLLVRGTARRKEMAVRSALGAGRGRLACQLISESLLLAIAGAFAGILPAWACIRLIANAKLESLPRPELLTLNLPVLGFALTLALITGVLFGLAPAWQLWRSDTNEPLKETQRSSSAGPQHRLTDLFVAGEVAVTMILLAGAFLMLRSFVHLRTADPGYDTERILTMRMVLSAPQYDAPERQAAFYKKVVERLASLPGVASAAATDLFPESDDIHGSGIYFAGRPQPKAGEVPLILVGSITPDYFRTLRIPILHGRSFTEADRLHMPLTAIVDEQAARQFWPHDNPLGKLIKLSGKDSFLKIVGVAGNVEQNLIVKLTKGRIGQVYLPFAQVPQSAVSLALSSHVEPRSLIPSVRAAIAGLDPDQPIFQIETIAEARAKTRTPARIATLLLGCFAALALLLAAVGIYGVISYTVGRRTREIGIRMALGAQQTDVLRGVIKKGGLLLLAGGAVGLAGAIALTRLMRPLLVSISANDPTTFFGVTLLLISVGLAASYVPARRASRVDPTIALRSE